MSSSYVTASNSDASLRAISQGRRADVENGHAKIKAYYSAVAQDFRAWSPKLNMHFGFWDWNVNPLDREAMLERMNLEVLNKLQLPAAGTARLADLGCGAGATARTIVQQRAQTSVDAVTLVMEQILQGAALNQTTGLRKEVKFHLADSRNRLTMFGSIAQNNGGSGRGIYF